MSDQPSVSELKQVARRKREELGLDSYLNCNPINVELKNELESEFPSLTVKLVDCRVRYTPRSMAGEEHVLVVVPDGQVQGATGDLYVDGALDQFCRENKEDGLVGTVLPSKTGDGPAGRNEFEPVEVFTKGNCRVWWNHLTTT